MTRLFISYRRDDSAYVAGMLCDRLQARFGQDAIFMDVATIPIGVDFRIHINWYFYHNCDPERSTTGRNFCFLLLGIILQRRKRFAV
ncbi:MAG: hypothetical protein F9B45_12900 [Phycisphaera sp. RhM]|nr:hypothetical protein [Phycisphaera sp. RhM]